MRATQLARLLRDPRQAARALIRAARALWLGGPRGLSTWLSRGGPLGEAISYSEWILLYDSLDARADRGSEAGPLFTLIPEPITDHESLQAALGAARMQLHQQWELLLTSLGPLDEAIRNELNQAVAQEPRIRWLGAKTTRTEAWQAAIDQARGSHLALLENTAQLRPHSLRACAAKIVGTPTIGLLFADHDHLGAGDRRRAPFFKPRFHPELAWSCDPFGPLALIDTKLARDLSLRPEFFPAERFDLLLRASAVAQVAQISEVLSHQRDEIAEPEGFADAAIRAVQGQLDRALPGARALPGPTPSTRRIQLGKIDQPPLISVIIPTRDGVRVLRRCVEGVLAKTDWAPLELIVVDNGSRDPETLAYLEELRRDARVQVLRDDGPFNFSALNNRAARAAKGELLALLNDDLEILEPGWLTQLAGHALRPGIGAAGARLLYPDGRVQHAGVATGVLGLAGHLMRGIAREDAGPNAFAKILRGSTVVTAACLVIRRALFLELGGFDERDLKVAFNDVELCLRLAQRGLRNLYVPEAELLHHESWSRGSDDAPGKRERFANELQTMILRWPALRADPMYSPNLTLASDQLEPGSPPREPW